MVIKKNVISSQSETTTQRVMKYTANFNVNNGTRLSTPLTGTNKNKLAKEIREYAAGQIFCDKTNVGTWWVADAAGRTIIEGNVFISKNLKPYSRTIKK